MGKTFSKMFRRRARENDMDAYERRRALRGYTALGQEMDPVPIAPPIGYKKQPSMVDHIRSMIRSERLREEAEAAGQESWEEADDFGPDDDDDFVPLSGYESDFDPPGVIEAKRRFKEAEEAKRSSGTVSPTPAAPEPLLAPVNGEKPLP